MIVNETVYAGSSTGRLFASTCAPGSQLWSGAVADRDVTAGAPGMAAGRRAARRAGRRDVDGARVRRRAAPGPRPAHHRRPRRPDERSLGDARLRLRAARWRRRTAAWTAGAWSPCLGSVDVRRARRRAAHVRGPDARPRRQRRSRSPRAAGRSTRPPRRARSAAAPSGVTYEHDRRYLAIRRRPAAAAGVPARRRRLGACDAAMHRLRPRHGAHRFEALARDAVGNVQATPASRTLDRRHDRPADSIDAGPQGATEPTAATFTFSADEPATFRCSMDYAWLGACSRRSR